MWFPLADTLLAGVENLFPAEPAMSIFGDENGDVVQEMREDRTEKSGKEHAARREWREWMLSGGILAAGLGLLLMGLAQFFRRVDRVAQMKQDGPGGVGGAGR